VSSGYLLDTSVLSVLAPGRPAPEPALAEWLRAHGDGLYVSSVTVAEIEQGIRKLQRQGGTSRAASLAAWLDALIRQGPDRILSFDAEAARIAGRLSDKAVAEGRHPGFPDVAIAATAVAHDLVVLTRNGRHFAALDVAFVDPLEELPE
jgi:predicted nucleic acid-binding protein